MRRHGWLATGLIGIAALAGLPAHAGSFAGVCTTSWTFTFAAPITNSSSPTPFNYSASGNCQTSTQPAAFKQAGIGGSGPGGLFTRCSLLQLDGNYVIDFDPPPAPLGSNGQIEFWGTASGGVLRMQGSNPTFIGVAVLVGGGLAGCSTNGAQVLKFTGVLTFIDP